MAKLFMTGLTQTYERRSYTALDRGNYIGEITEVSLWAKEPVTDEEGNVLNATAIKGKIDITDGPVQKDGSDAAGRKITFFMNLPEESMEAKKRDFFAMRIQSLVLSAGVPFGEEGFDPDSLVDKTVKFTVDYQRDYKTKQFKLDDNGNKQSEIKNFLFDEKSEQPAASNSKSASAPAEDFDFT